MVATMKPWCASENRQIVMAQSGAAMTVRDNHQRLAAVGDPRARSRVYFVRSTPDNSRRLDQWVEHEAFKIVPPLTGSSTVSGRKLRSFISLCQRCDQPQTKQCSHSTQCTKGMQERIWHLR